MYEKLLLWKYGDAYVGYTPSVLFIKRQVRTTSFKMDEPKDLLAHMQ